MKSVWILAAFAAVLGIASTQASAQPPKHVIIISIDGLHQDDLTDPALQSQIPNILALSSSGVWYSNASGTNPSDSFPGTMAYVTGAGPATTGIFYDENYDRSLLAPGVAANGPLGVSVQNTEVVDKDSDLINGGGDLGKGSIDPAKLPVDPSKSAPVYPHQGLRVNTIFEVAHAAGLRTSMIDKHPAYEIASGPSGTGVDDLYCPEIQAKAALVDGKLVDDSNAPEGTKLKRINKNVLLAMAYDDMKVGALMRELSGKDARGSAAAPVPSLVCINLQAVNIAEKSKTGGIDVLDGKEVPSQEILDALKHTDADISMVVGQLKAAGLWDQTLIVLTAKHGQNPRVGSAINVPGSTILDPLQAANIAVASSVLDDLAVIWLKDPSQTEQAAKLLQTAAESPSSQIDRILWGDSMQAAHLAGPATRTPDIIVVMKPGTGISDKPKRSEHGGFVPDDTHVPVILAGGLLDEKHHGLAVSDPVKTTQIAVTALNALNLDSSTLQGAKIEGTTALPNSGFETPGIAQADLHN